MRLLAFRQDMPCVDHHVKRFFFLLTSVGSNKYNYKNLLTEFARSTLGFVVVVVLFCFVFVLSCPPPSPTKMCLVFITFNRKTFGERSFYFIGPTVWNSIPFDIRSIKSTPGLRQALKTQLFKSYFLSVWPNSATAPITVWSSCTSHILIICLGRSVTLVLLHHSKPLLKTNLFQNCF